MQPDVFQESPVIDPFKEAVIWESIWSMLSPPTFKQYYDRQKGYYLPSDISFGIKEEDINATEKYLRQELKDSVTPLVNSSGIYPEGLNKLRNRSPIIYATGNLELLYGKLISVVGSRKISKEGIRRTEIISRKLVRDGFTIVSGLAEGVDTIAHTSALKGGGDTIAVVGTPLNVFYPRKNKELQQLIGKDHLVLSQVPFMLYQSLKKNNFRLLKQFFPERNKVMAAISVATVIVEASDTSGTLIQARECLRMGKKLFLHESVVQNPESKWATRYASKEGVYVVNNYSQIKKALE